MKARLRCCGLGRFASSGAEAEGAVTAIAFIEIRDNPSERDRLRPTVNAPPAGESQVNQVGWIHCRDQTIEMGRNANLIPGSYIPRLRPMLWISCKF